MSFIGSTWSDLVPSRVDTSSLLSDAFALDVNFYSTPQIFHSYTSFYDPCLMQNDLDLVTFVARAQATNLAQWFEHEPNVNATWNAILHTAFPPNTGHWLIHPEGYPKPGDTQGQQNDLRVTQLNPLTLDNQNRTASFDERVHLCFEGKGADKESWEKVRRQLQDFIKTAVGGNQTSTCWAIGARGTNVMFWRYQRLLRGTNLVNDGEWMVPIFVNTEGNIVDDNRNAGKLAEPCRIDDNWDQIRAIVEMMANNLPTPRGS